MAPLKMEEMEWVEERIRRAVADGMREAMLGMEVKCNERMAAHVTTCPNYRALKAYARGVWLATTIACGVIGTLVGWGLRLWLA
jgi:hypothetical protein